MTAESRASALADLLQLRRPIAEALPELRQFPWDSEAELATLTRLDARRALEAFLSGALSASEGEAWADAIEGRDDVGFESGFEDVLKEFVFELANPAMTRPLTLHSAEDWRDRLT